MQAWRTGVVGAARRRSLVCTPWPLQRIRAVTADAGTAACSRGGRPYSGAVAAGDALLEHESEHIFCSTEQYRSVVKVFNVMSTPNYLMPWQNKPHRDSTGSGFAIDGRRIITNAHVVADSKHCQVRKHGEASKFTATVVGVSHECDLAMLAVEDEAFWEDLHPLDLGGIPGAPRYSSPHSCSHPKLRSWRVADALLQSCSRL